MLKMTGVKLDLISDIDMHLFIEKGHSEIKDCDNKEQKLLFIGMKIICMVGQ